MTVPPAPVLTLANGIEMPQLALGTWAMNDAEAAVAPAQRFARELEQDAAMAELGVRRGRGDAVDETRYRGSHGFVP